MRQTRSLSLLLLLAGCSGDDNSNPQPISPTPASGTSGGVSGTGTAVAGSSAAGSGAAGSGAGGTSASGSGGRSATGAAGMTASAGASGSTTAGTAAAGEGGMSGAASMQPPAAGASGSAGAAGAGGGEPMTPTTAMNCLKGSGDYEADGPYKVKSKTVTVGSKGMYTIFYPDPLEAACPHPIVAWGNGTTITGGTAYDHFHNHAASYGIVTISSHNSNVGDGTFHTAAIDYLLEQNKDSASEFFGKLSARAGVSGHSQGGAGSDRASTHMSVQAIVNVQGSFGTPPAGKGALLCLTGTEDIQPTGCPMAVRAAKVPAVSANWDGADHVSTTLLEGEGIEQYKRLYSAWFRCFLADDANACAMFKGGADCPVCNEPGWEEIFANNY